MTRIFLLPAVLFLSLTAIISSAAEDSFEINTTLMRSTFKIADEKSAGTVFILAKPVPSNPKLANYVLVTANHVLNDMEGDVAVLFLRRKVGDTFQKIPWPIKIRLDGRPVWTTHPDADVAVMYISIPTDADVTPLPTDLLATDEILKKFNVHPGDRLSCLGYPLAAEANGAGFPILRSGQIASFPLTPTKTVKTFAFDFNVFEGNSGGPVYLSDSNRIYEGTTNIGSVQFLMGLVSQQWSVKESYKTRNEEGKHNYPLGIAIVINASLIREALDLLPSPP